MKLKPVRMFLLHDGRGGMVSRKIVPNDYDFATIVTMNFVQPIETFRGIHSLRKQGKTKSKVKTSRRDRDEAESRGRGFPWGFDQRRCHANRCPGPATIRSKRKPAFVPQNQDRVLKERFFLMRGQTDRIQWVIFA